MIVKKNGADFSFSDFNEYKRLKIEKQSLNERMKSIASRIDIGMINQHRITPKMKDALRPLVGMEFSKLMESDNIDLWDQASSVFNMYNEVKSFSIHETDYLKMLDNDLERPEGFQFPNDFNLDSEMKMRIGLLTIIGARPGVGKTSVMILQMMDDIANEIPCIVFSIEMPPKDLVWKLLSMYIYYQTNQDFNIGEMKQYYKKNRDELKKYIARIKKYCIILESSRWKASKIISSFNYHRDDYYKRTGLNLQKVYIDYFQRIRKETKSHGTTDELNDSLSLITSTAKISDCAWVMLSQENRLSDSRSQEKNASLKGTGNLEEDMGLGIILFRPVDKETDRNEARLKIKITKNRYGPKGSSWVDLAEKSGAIRNDKF